MTISIIIPIYNAQLSIGKTIETILEQTYPDWELLLVNDGSVDNSENICHSFSKKDHRIKVVSQKNKGVSAARNKGIDLAIGEFIVFIDADDEILPCYLQDLLNDYYVNNCPDIVMQGFIEEYKKNKKKKIIPTNKSKVYNLENELYFFYEINLLKYGYPFSKLFLREIISRNNLHFSDELTFCEDLVFLMNYMLYCKLICISDKANYLYNFTPSSLSHRIHCFESEFKSYHSIKENYRKLLKKYNLSLNKQQILLKENYNMITRPFASIITVNKGSFSDKRALVNTLDDEYFDILKYYFSQKKFKYSYLAIICNKKMWLFLAGFFYFKYRMLPLFSKIIRDK